MRLTILHKGLILIAVPLACQVGFVAAYDVLLSAARQTLKEEFEWQEFCIAAQNLENTSQQIGIRALLGAMSGQPLNARTRMRALKEVVAAMKSFRQALQLDSVKKAGFVLPQQAQVNALPVMAAVLYSLSVYRIEPDMRLADVFSVIGVPPSMLAERFQDGRAPMAQVLQLLERAQAFRKEQRLLFDRESLSIEQLVHFVMFANVVLGAALSLYFFRDISRRIGHVQENTRLLSRMVMPVAPIGGSDEIAELDVSVHRCADEILKLEAFKREMIGMASHELKAPLTSVQGVVSLLFRGAFGPVSGEIVERAEMDEANLDRLIRLVNDLLTLETLKDHGFKLDLRRTSVLALVEGAVSAVESLAVSRQVLLQYEGGDWQITVDRDRLVQVLVNLLSNAIKFSDGRSPILVTALSDGSQTEFSVRNTGPGILPEHRDGIFQRFSQASPADGIRRVGSGLGLAIAKSIVEQHGGQIELTSGDRETTFSFHVPNQPLLFPDRNETMQAPPSVRAGVRLRLWHKGLLLVGIPILINLLFLCSLKYLWMGMVSSLERTRTSSTMMSCALLTSDALISSAWLAILATGGMDELREIYDEYVVSGDKHLVALQSLARSTGRSDVQGLVEVALNLKEISKRIAQGHQLTVGDVRRVNQFQAISSFTALGAVLLSKEQNSIRNEDRAQARFLGKIKLLLMTLPVANLVVSLLLLLFFYRSISTRIVNVSLNASRLAERQVLSQPAGGTDEIAELDELFHAVASQILALEQFKEQMIGIVSHELRSPLTSTLLSLQMMRKGVYGVVSSKAEERLALAEEETERLIRLINNLLDLEKLQAGRLKLFRSEFQLRETIAKAERSVRYLAENAGIQVVCEAGAIAVNWDEDRIVQILVNLLSNAIKFSPKGSTVTVRAQKADGIVELAVADQGRGISSGEQSKLFHRFQQIATDDYKLGGTGLGLAISKWLVELHGGTIEVDSEAGCGTTFRCRLPKTPP